MKHHFRLVIFVLMASLKAHAFEPPRGILTDALRDGKVAFLAKAVKSGPVQESAYEVLSTIKLKVEYCFYGNECTVGDSIDMSYVVKTIKETTLPVQFPLGTDIIFIMSHKVESKTHFDSRWEGGIDRAYVCDNYPTSIMRSKVDVSCLNIYGGNKKSWINWEKLTSANR